jgi:hypothetical protein
LTQAITNIKFIHTGYHIEADQLDKKLARNIAICEKALAKNPDDLYLQFIKLNSQGHTDPENALNALEKIVFDVPDDTPIIKYHAAAYLYLANREFQRKNREQVARIVRGLVIDFPFDSHLLQFAGELALYELQDLDEALFILTIAQERRATHMIEDMLPPTIYNLQNIRWRLVEVSVLLGDLSRAKHYYSQIEFPNHRKLDAKRKNELHHLLEQNDPEKFLKESQDVLLDDVKLIRARAKMLLASQQWSKAIEEILNAASKTGLEFTDLLDLATCQTQSGHDNYAEYMLDMARRIEADHPIEASIRSFIAARQGNHEKALDYAARAFLLESSNPNFQANLEHLARHLGKNPVDVLKEKGSEWQANLDLAYSMRAYIAYSRFHPEDAEVKSILDDMLKPS